MENIVNRIEKSLNLRHLETKYYYQINKDIFSLVFSDSKNCLILDFNITDIPKSESIFSYANYINHQNELMYFHQQLYRFLIEDDLDEKLSIFNLLICDNDQDFIYHGKYFEQRSMDNSPLESHFEECFENIYGASKLQTLSKEYNLSTLTGANIFVDYVLETNKIKYAVEENGITYHHPQIIKNDKYNFQLEKQNMLVYYNFKVYRWSTEHLQFKDKVCDSMKLYFGDGHNFINNSVIKAERKVSILEATKQGFNLYDHQKEILFEISESKKNNINTFLVVLPTATGKSQIGIEEIKELISIKNDAKILILVPTTRIKSDWLSNIRKLKHEFPFIDFGSSISNNISISSYRYMYKNKYQVESDYFDYIIFDEAHHAVAPECRKILEYFNPQFLLGLTATPERLDKQRLEDIFGTYNSKLTIVEAIEKDIVPPIRAFRLESNLDLKKIRFNGHEFVNADLEKYVRVESRNKLIANMIKRYFVNDEICFQGIVFCVNVKHTLAMEKELNEMGISAKAVYGSNPNNEEIFDNYKRKKINFLCTCDLINEGWDSPQTSVIVMARPTLSKVLYTQQLGRGLRKYPGKECLYVIDVVDQYGGVLTPWNIHSLLNIPIYIPFGDVLNPDLKTEEMILIQGLSEQEIALREIDIFTFENKYGDYLGIEEAARELFISTGTLRSWIKKNEVIPSLVIEVGVRPYYMFNKETISEIRIIKGLKEHTEETIKEDFYDFINQKDYTFSFKIIFMLGSLKIADNEGEVNLNKLLALYRKFYLDRIELNLPVDRPSVIYNRDYLCNDNKLKENMLSNPFEKYERKRFMYYSKDLNLISFNPILWSKLNDFDLQMIKNILIKHLEEYYQSLGGLHSINYLI